MMCPGPLLTGKSSSVSCPHHQQTAYVTNLRKGPLFCHTLQCIVVGIIIIRTLSVSCPHHQQTAYVTGFEERALVLPCIIMHNSRYSIHHLYKLSTPSANCICDRSEERIFVLPCYSSSRYYVQLCTIFSSVGQKCIKVETCYDYGKMTSSALNFKVNANR